MSESGAGPADRAGAPLGQGQPSGARDALELVPHSGRVAIEVVDGQTWAVDSSTLRMDALPAGCWSAEADAEGFVCFVSDEGETILAEDVLRRSLWRDPGTGELFIAQRQESGAEMMFSLSEKR